MSSKMTRRTLLAAALGATQLALLDRLSPFGIPRARAASGDGPTRLLVLYMGGGVRFHEQFVPLSDAHIEQTTPPNANPGSEPIFFGPSQVMTFPGDSGSHQPLRMSFRWNPADPSDRTRFEHSPLGYSWVHHDLGGTTAVIHGVDNGSVAHGAARIGAMCGLAGGSYRAPALVSLVAKHLHRTHGDARPIPCVAVRAGRLPRAAGLSSEFAPFVLPGLDTVKELVTGSGADLPRWVGSDAREAVDAAALGASGPYEGRQTTAVEAHLLERARILGGTAGGERYDILENLHRNYAAVSKTLALDVVSRIQETVPTTVARPDHLASYHTDYGFTFGLANYSMDMTPTAEWVLSLLKSDVTSVVYADLGYANYDTHGTQTALVGHGVMRGQLDIIARILGELKATPSPDRPGCTLYDDTIVLVQSEFNRSWATGPSRTSNDGWYNSDGHNNFTSVVLSGGAVAGNRQIGGFHIDGMAHGIASGEPVAIRSETGEMESRPPRASDVVATVADLFGMEAGTDYFIPGGYGVIGGLRRG